jgi:hypothetical protein
VSTNFPAGLDSFTNPTPTDPQSSPSHSAQHANANDAIVALQSKIGTDGSADPDSIDNKIAVLQGKSHTHVWNEIPAGDLDGSNRIFTLVHAPNPAGSLLLFLNGILQRAGGNDYTLASATVTFVSAPGTTDVLLAQYVY